ncbi:MAG: hypothetical protein NTX85_00825 [Candidatus Nomurabacteria bacterium]|nr:hypothetical protein [Candidatus Nomurabacteria bacterium]
MRKTHEKIVVGGATFHDGYLFTCLVNGFGDVRDINGNHPIHMPCTDPLIKQRLDPNQGGWNFACQGACRVGGSCDAIVLVYDDDGTLVNHPDYPKTVGNWVLDEFLGDDQHFVKLIDKAKLPKVDISFNLPVSIQSLRELQKDTIIPFEGPKEIIFTFTK